MTSMRLAGLQVCLLLVTVVTTAVSGQTDGLSGGMGSPLPIEPVLNAPPLVHNCDGRSVANDRRDRLTNVSRADQPQDLFAIPDGYILRGLSVNDPAAHSTWSRSQE